MTQGDGRGATRPLCRCHGVAMDPRGDGRGWSCAEDRRARARAKYHADPASANYARTRQALRARIAAKRARITELEEHLATQERDRDEARSPGQDGP